MLLSDITGNDLSDTDTETKLKETFSAYHEQRSYTVPENSRFTDADASYNTYRIKKYMDIIKPGCSTFQVRGGETTYTRNNPVKVSENSTVITDDSYFSKMTVSQKYGGMAVWMAMPSDECAKNLTQAAVMWLGSQGFHMKDANFFAVQPPEGIVLQSISYPVMFTTSDNNMGNAEIANVRLIIWRVFF